MIKKHKMLIIEDEPGLRFLLEYHFINKYYITIVSSVYDALKHITNAHINKNYEDIVLCEYELGHPKIDGLILLNQIQYTYLNNPALILLSSNPIQSRYKNITKPLDLHKLETIIESMLQS